MMKNRLTAITLALALFLSLTACSSDATPDSKDPVTPVDSAAQPSAKTEDGPSDTLDEALGDRDILALSLESALSSDNATANWQRDTLTVSLDGDVEELTDKFSHCRIVGHFLVEGDTLILQYPNGSVDCADIPELEGQLIW